jgi:hypothetical protein
MAKQQIIPREQVFFLLSLPTRKKHIERRNQEMKNTG